MKIAPRPALLAAAVVAVACESTGGGRSGLESAARDSAGITIVENQEPASETRLGWLIGEAPILSIGALEGNPAYELYQVRDAARLPDGRIVVANAGSGELRVFDPSGTHLASWGGRGEGPGEFGDFAAPWNVGPWPGDSIAAVGPVCEKGLGLRRPWSARPHYCAGGSLLPPVRRDA